MRSFPSLVAFLALILGATSGRSATELPFAYKGGMVWLKVEAQGRRLNFVLDSGAGASVVDAGVARLLGLKRGATETVQGVDGNCAACRVEDFAGTIGSLSVPRGMLALDLGSVSRSCGSHIDGLIGLDFFRGRTVQIDYPARVIRVSARGEEGAPSGECLALKRRNDAFCVRVSMQGADPVWMRLDTGCSSAVEWVMGAAKASGGRGPSVAAGMGSAKGTRMEVRIGEQVVHEVETGLHAQAMFPGEAGLVGNGVWANFCVTLDVDGGRVWLRRGK